MNLKLPVERVTVVNRLSFSTSSRKVVPTGIYRRKGKKMALYDLIKNFPLFQNFSEEEKQAFCQIKHSLIKYKKGDFIIREGDTYASLYLLVKGTISITRTGYNEPISILKDGALFGEMSYFTKKPRFSNVIADGDVVVLKMDSSFFDKVGIEIKEKINTFLMELLINRLDIMNESLSKIAKYARGFTLP
jgi:CRP-like cAMP-binding protein